ncbi:hypothetical protein BDR22DRAFT_822506 [Usnea florida]
MRQRGAGTRQVKNTGFDLVLPGHENVAIEPLQAIKSGRSRKTPQPELPLQRSARTPKTGKSQLQRSSRKTPAARTTKKRGRPAEEGGSDELGTISTTRVIEADEEGNATKRRKVSKAQKERGDVENFTGPQAHGDGTGERAFAPKPAPGTGVKKRRKRKSIGQQSTSRAKSAKLRSPLKPAYPPLKRIKQDTAGPTEATQTNGLLAKRAKEGQIADALLLDRDESARLPETTVALEPEIENIEPSIEDRQTGNTKLTRKRKQVAVEELPRKHFKASFSRTKRAPKALKTQNETIGAEDTREAIQNTEKSTEVEAVSLDHGLEGEEAAVSNTAEPPKKKPKKRKRVTVGQQPKKTAKASMTQTHRRPKAQEEANTAGAPDTSQDVGKPAEFEADSMGHGTEEQGATVTDVKTQSQKPKRKKRKSIGQQKPKKKSMDLATPTRSASKKGRSVQLHTKDDLDKKPTAKRGRPRAKRQLEEVTRNAGAKSMEHVPEDEGEPEPRGSGLRNKPQARRGRPKANPRSENNNDKPDQGVSRDALEEEKEVQVPVLPEKKKRGRPRKAVTSSPTSQPTKAPRILTSRNVKPKAASTAPKTRAPPKNTIPITIYSIRSPTPSDIEEDPLSTTSRPPRPTTNKNTVNAVDVLSQICSELLAQSSASLTEQIHSDPNPTQLKRTKQTTDLYAQELASHLLQLTTTLNANTALHSRVRAAAKEERGLKKELKRLEKEREDTRVRKEEVVKEKKKRKLEELLSGIAGAVKKGWAMQKEAEEGDAVAGMNEEMDLEV